MRGPKRRPLIDRFNEKWIPVTESGCWLWTATTSRGYGHIGLGGKYGKPKSAHRVSYETYKGPIPEGMCVCHKCDVKCCVNPDHLFLGTYSDNVADMDRKGRRNPTPVRGAANSQSKLTEDDVHTIRSSNDTQRVIAKKYGVSQALISKIKRRELWYWINDDC